MLWFKGITRNKEGTYILVGVEYAVAILLKQYLQVISGIALIVNQLRIMMVMMTFNHL